MIEFDQNNRLLNLSLFYKYRDMIYKTAGIYLSDKKITLLSNRLRKRLKARNIADYQSYYEYLMSHPEDKQELTAMIDVVTTNVTHFFRNPKQLEIFQNKFLPEVIQKKTTPLKILSAGCSTGEEPYTLALILVSSFPSQLFHIDAVDISTHALEKARQGIYEQDKVIEHLSKTMLLKYFEKTLDGKYKISDDIKKHISFSKQNIVSQPFQTIYDIIFCRNVVIYFDKPTKEKVYNHIYSALSSDGYFFVGHSEGLINNTKFRYIMPGVYMKIKESVHE